MKRPGQPKELAPVYVKLAADEAIYYPERPSP